MKNFQDRAGFFMDPDPVKKNNGSGSTSGLSFEFGSGSGQENSYLRNRISSLIFFLNSP